MIYINSTIPYQLNKFRPILYQILRLVFIILMINLPPAKQKQIFDRLKETSSKNYNNNHQFYSYSAHYRQYQNQNVSANPSKNNRYSKSSKSMNQMNFEIMASTQPAKRQPLRLKFKGIILNKVLGQIYQKYTHQSLNESIKILKNVKDKTSKRSRLSVEELWRRTMMVLIETMSFTIQNSLSQVKRQAFQVLSHHNS